MDILFQLFLVKTIIVLCQITITRTCGRICKIVFVVSAWIISYTRTFYCSQTLGFVHEHIILSTCLYGYAQLSFPISSSEHVQSQRALFFICIYILPVYLVHAIIYFFLLETSYIIVLIKIKVVAVVTSVRIVFVLL